MNLIACITLLSLLFSCNLFSRTDDELDNYENNNSENDLINNNSPSSFQNNNNTKFNSTSSGKKNNNSINTFGKDVNNPTIPNNPSGKKINNPIIPNNHSGKDVNNSKIKKLYNLHKKLGKSFWNDKNIVNRFNDIWDYVETENTTPLYNKYIDYAQNGNEKSKPYNYDRNKEITKETTEIKLQYIINNTEVDIDNKFRDLTVVLGLEHFYNFGNEEPINQAEEAILEKKFGSQIDEIAEVDKVLFLGECLVNNPISHVISYQRYLKKIYDLLKIEKDKEIKEKLYSLLDDLLVSLEFMMPHHYNTESYIAFHKVITPEMIQELKK